MNAGRRALALGLVLAALLPALAPAIAQADPAAESMATIRVAVAANFLASARELAAAYQEQGGGPVQFVGGATGMLATQIRQGAPFDVLLAADSESVDRLAAEGLTVPGSEFVYAIGSLVLWSPDPGLVDAAGAVLRSDRIHHLAIANAALAPYGRAAEQTLASLGLATALSPRIVRGESIGQAFEFVASGNAEAGFVALSQLGREDARRAGSVWRVPESRYAPIVQKAAALSRSAAPQAARAWLAFLQGARARSIIAAWGYRQP